MDLFTPLSLGELQLDNRITMAPMTRLRSGSDGVPDALVAEYYAQRAGLGLIVTEGVYPVAESRAYPGQPGIETPEQIAAWTTVTDAVHTAGGVIVMQLMHGGRVSHPEITGTPRIVAPSAIAIQSEVRTPVGKLPFPVPHALTAAELDETRAALVTAARNAIDAGFDGVEVHGANGYLLHEFLSPASNVRTDGYGGSPENRASFVAEVVAAIAEEIGAGRTGLRISPAHNIQDVWEKDADETRATYLALIEAIAPLGLAYLSVLQSQLDGELVQELRAAFGGPVLLNSGFGSPTTRAEAESLLGSGLGDAIAVGRLAISNPDLARRWQLEAPENDFDASLFYTPGAHGYTDYAELGAEEKVATD